MPARDSDFSNLSSDLRDVREGDEDNILELLRAHRRESKEWRREQMVRMDKMEIEVSSMRAQLQQNTEMTATVRDVMKRFMDRIEAHYGKRPIIYTSVDFHRDNLVGTFEGHHFWLRSVAAHPGETYAGRRWAFWQYTSTGIVPGIQGETDINVFAGTTRNWNSWLASLDR